MKKHVLSIILGCMTAFTLSAQDQHIGDERLKDLVGSYIYNTVVFYKGNSWFLPLKYFAFGAIPGATVGAVMTAANDPGASATNIRDYAIVSGIATGVVGLIGEYAARFNNVQIMNKYLNEYTSFERFKELSDPQAAMLCAANLKNINAMKNLKPYLMEFLKDKGVWKVLTELYFDEPEKVISTTGSSLRPGYSTRGGFNVDYVTQDSVSTVRRTFMNSKTMKRRMKVLKAKLGYKE